MGVLSHLEPQSVFHFFEEICRIPHGSGNTGQISDYLLQFAKERKLECYQDAFLNIIMIREATAGYEDHEPVMLQGHMDMVAVKTPEAEVDLQKDPLKPQVEGDRIFARDTSLGGDDGIAVAYGLALMDDPALQAPRLELVITTEEEVGMDGARNIDLSVCKAHRMINLDSEEEGFFLVGCAGGARVNLQAAYQEEKKRGRVCSLKITGLQGGHSGSEIHKGRANAICILARVLVSLIKTENFRILFLEGGQADNAIPREAGALLLLEEQEEAAIKRLEQRLALLNRELQAEYEDRDAGIQILAEDKGIRDAAVMEQEASMRLLCLLNSLPQGVQAMSSLPGLVETSLNTGVLTCAEGKLKIGILVRSSVESAKYALIQQLESLAELAGVRAEISGDYPGWKYRKHSPLRTVMEEVYREQYGRDPVIQTIHAGLECGLLQQKVKDLDCVSIGPDMKNIHTTEEELSIASVGRVWEFLKAVLEQL